MKKYFVGSAFALLLIAVISLYLTVQDYQEKARNPFRFNLRVNEEVLRQKLAHATPQWMVEQIDKDLKPFQEKGISMEKLDPRFRGQRIEDLNVVRFTVSNRHLSFAVNNKTLDRRQFRQILAFFTKLNDLVPLPDVDFMVSMEDGFSEDLGLNYPLMVYAKAKSADGLLLIPDFKALVGYNTLRQRMTEGGKKYPWDKKKPQAFWRGATTGGYLTLANWDQFARTKLVLLSLKHPQEVDARINKFVQCDPAVPELLQAKGMRGNTVDQMDHLKYKYLIDVDGNTCTFERCFWELLSNSLLFKQETPNIQWYYGALKPFEHYVPVKEDLSDLLEKLAWAKAHDAEAQQIAENATAFVKQNLNAEDSFIYMAYLLQEYAKLQRD